MNKILNYLGIARRAGFLITGTDAVIASLGKTAKLVIVAKDASLSTIDKLDKKCYFYNVKMINNFETIDIAKAIGQKNPKVICITDKGIATQIINIIERGESHDSKTTI